jgi:hypothetical protein
MGQRGKRKLGEGHLVLERALPRRSAGDHAADGKAGALQQRRHADRHEHARDVVHVLGDV